MKALLLLTTLFVFSLKGETFKIAVMAPDGTEWAESLKEFSLAVKEKTNGRVVFKFWFGGSQGDESDMLRKMQIGQLHGGIFTGKTLGKLNGDIRVMEVPYTFGHDREKAYEVLKKMTPFFDEGLKKSRFPIKNLGFFELGMVRLISTKKVSSLQDLNGVKIWSWEGDELVESLIKTMNLISIPLPLSDVLSSLSTGIVEAAYSPPLAILALQWNTKVKYLVDFPITYSISAFLVSKKQWDKVEKNDQLIIEKFMTSQVDEVNRKTVKDNQDSLAALKLMGMEFINFSKEDEIKGIEIRNKVRKNLVGKLFSQEALNQLESFLQK